MLRFGMSRIGTSLGSNTAHFAITMNTVVTGAQNLVHRSHTTQTSNWK